MMETERESKERPILFSGPMVRAILAGQKTQTRRIWKMPKGYQWYTSGPIEGEKTGDYCDIAGKGWWSVEEDTCSPYGSVGDRLWVRETWSPMPENRPIPYPEKYNNKPAWYRADGDRPLWAGTKWRPSIFMPREYSRITLQITDVRVERLQKISRGDCMAEGCPFPNIAGETDPQKWFSELWESINGPDSWASNPWVWVIEFNRLKPSSL